MNADLHIIDLRKSITHLETCKKLLSPAEIERMSHFVTPELQQKFALCHGQLRLTLAQYLEQDPAVIRFTHNEFGKPFIEGHTLQFNMAHSGDYCAIAFSAKNSVGIDIERCDENHHSFDIAKRFFTPREYDALQTAADPVTLFFHIWTQKEAFLKAIGRGLAFGLDQFEVATDLNESYVENIKDPAYADQTWESESYGDLKGYRLTLTVST